MTGRNIRSLPAIGIVAEVSCRYFREMGFPEPVEVGLRAERVGTSSVVYRVGLFQGPGDEACAEGRFVHVYVDNTVDALPADPSYRSPTRSEPSSAGCCDPVVTPLTSGAGA